MRVYFNLDKGNKCFNIGLSINSPFFNIKAGASNVNWYHPATSLSRLTLTIPPSISASEEVNKRH